MSTKAELDLMESVIDTKYSLFLRRKQKREETIKDIRKFNNPFRAFIRLFFGR